MATCKLICIYILMIFVKHSTCHKHSIQQTVEEIKNISKQMYGDLAKEYRQFKTENIDELLYPNGDKPKLRLLSSLWRDYYDCSVLSLHKLTNHRQVPLTMVMVYVGGVARLPCAVCVAPNERSSLQWLYAESTSNMTFSPMLDKERMIEDRSNLTIYNVQLEDAGVYRCEIGESRSMMVVEVVDDDDYNVVKPLTSLGPYAAPPQTLDCGLKVFTSWSPWSECSTCGMVGRRHRHGICYVKLHHKLRSRRTYNDIVLDKSEVGLLEAFSGGMPCQSTYLPFKVRAIEAIQQRRNEIMIAMCKVACSDTIYYKRSENGDILETANNTAGIYSLSQLLPKQPPLPVRDTIFADFGEFIAIRCPGTTLRDVPVTWRFGNTLMVPREVDRATDGRVYINSRDHLVITKVFYRDENLYSCWQHDKLAGAVRLVVLCRVCARGGVLLALVLALALLHLTQRAARGR